MKIEKISKKSMVEELLYLLTDIEGYTLEEAQTQVNGLKDIEIVKTINIFYDGTGVKYAMI